MGDRSVDKLTEVPLWVLIAGEAELLHGLVVLEQDKPRLLVTVAMVLGDDGECLLTAVVGNDEPSRVFGNEHDQGHDAGWHQEGPGEGLELSMPMN